MKNLLATLIIGISAAQLMGVARQQTDMNPGGANEQNGVAASQAAVPAALVGKWHSGSLAATNFYDASTQQWNEPNGRGMFLIVQANGEYCFGAGEQIAATQYFIYQEGSVAIHGSQLVLAPQAGSEYARDLSATQRAASKAELQASTFKYQIVQDRNEAQGAKLVLTNEYGEVVTLRQRAQ